MSASNRVTDSSGRFDVKKNSRALRWAVGAGLAAMVAIGLVLLFLLTQATTNRAMYERNYTRLFALNVVVATLLLLVIAWIAFRLVARLRKGKFGSRLLIKLAAVFALASIGAVVAAAVAAGGAIVVLMTAGASIALAGMLVTGDFSVLFMGFFQ